MFDFQREESSPFFQYPKTKQDTENPRSSWTSWINSINFFIKVAVNAFDLDLNRLANLTENNTFLGIADYTLLYLSSNITDFNHILHKYPVISFALKRVEIINSSIWDRRDKINPKNRKVS